MHMELFFFQAEDGIRDIGVTGVQTCALPIFTNATFLTFAEGGGYERREWWSDEGWAWKEEYDITHPEGWERRRPVAAQPVQHVSWFEADAFARSRGARLPTEAEWERAATWDQGRAIDAVGAVWEWTSTEFTG